MNSDQTGLPYLLSEAEISLFYQAADGSAITSAPIWFGCGAQRAVFSAVSQTFVMNRSGAQSQREYQGNLIHAVQIDRVWRLPKGTMLDFVPERNQRFVMQFAWLDLQTRLQYQRTYFGVLLKEDQLISRGATWFEKPTRWSAETMAQCPC